MADSHYTFERNNSSKPAGWRLGQAFEQFEKGVNGLKAERLTMIQMCDNVNTTQAANFGTHVTAYGFADTAEAKAAFDELDSLWAALNGIMATIEQANARFRN